MKAGAESKTKLRIAIVLCVIAVLTVARMVISGGAPKPESAPVTASSPEQIRAAYANESLDPRLRLDMLANSENIQYEGKGTNIFRERAEQVEIPKPVKSPIINRNDPSKPNYTPPPPPPPPPINLKYFGMTSSKNEKPKAFLSQGDDVWIARE